MNERERRDYQFLCPNCGTHAVWGTVMLNGDRVIVADGVDDGVTEIVAPSRADAEAFFASMCRTAEVLTEVAQRWPGQRDRIALEVTAIRTAEQWSASQATTDEVTAELDLAAFQAELARTGYVPSDWPRVI